MHRLALNLKCLRERKKMTQKQLAKHFNISQTSIVHYEKGDRQPSIQLLLEFSDFFGVTIDKLVGNDRVKKRERLNFDKNQALKDLKNVLIKKDHRKFMDYIERLLSVMDLKIVIEDYLKELLYYIGEEWEKGHITEADEHYATNIVRKSISSLVYYDTIELRSKRAIALTVASEKHNLGIELVSELLEKHGIETLYLGSDLPMRSLLYLIDEYLPEYIFISITLREHMNNLVILIEKLSEKSIERIFVGGQGIFKSEKVFEKYDNVRVILTLDELLDEI